MKLQLIASALVALGLANVEAATRMNLGYNKTCFAPGVAGGKECLGTTDRALIYTNNPEALIAGDMADRAGTVYSIHTVDLAAGNYRDFASHIANSGIVGGNIGYALVFRNTSGRSINLKIRGKSAIDSCQPGNAGGADIFASVFNNYDSAQENYTIAAGATKFLPVTGSAPNYVLATSSCPNMLTDFDITGSVQLLHIAYKDARNVNLNFASYVPMSYITGPSAISGAAPEDRFYKGTSPFNAVSMVASTTLSPSDAVGQRVPLQYVAYDGQVKLRDFGPSSLFDRTWWTNVNAGGNSGASIAAMSSDVLSFNFRRSFQGQTTNLTFSPTTVDGTGKIHNLGNWGVVYMNTIFVTNNENRSRIVEMVMSPVPNQSFHIANYDSGLGRWKAQKTNGNGDIVYASCRIPAFSTSPCKGLYVIGAPSSADLLHYLRIAR